MNLGTRRHRRHKVLDPFTSRFGVRERKEKNREKVMNLERRRHEIIDPVTSHFGVRERKEQNEK